MLRKILCAALWAALLVPPLRAANVDLVTLPRRQGVQLTIYNSEDITLVKETRAITFKLGRNELQFSWAGTLIDPTSVEFRPLDHQDEVTLLDTVFPGQKPQHLIWNVESRFEGQVLVEVTYFTSGLTWSMDYVGQVNPDETAMRFRGYLRVFNRSGEEYEDAQIRLIVGTINLVEKIADLAGRQGMAVPPKSAEEFEVLKKQAVRESIGRAERAKDSEAKEIVKEGLSEYFMFTVDGAETVQNGWSKRMQALDARDAGFEIVYRMRDYQYGPRPVRFFIWNNDEKHKLGASPLPDGLIRLFRENGKDGLAFLGQQMVRYVPIKAAIEINLGPDDLVVYERNGMGARRFNFNYDQHTRVDGWDAEEAWVDTVRNYRAQPIAFELRRVWDGDVEYASSLAAALFDYHTVETRFPVPSRDQVKVGMTVLHHLGTNAKQAHVKMK